MNVFYQVTKGKDNVCNFILRANELACFDRLLAVTASSSDLVFKGGAQRGDLVI